MPLPSAHATLHGDPLEARFTIREHTSTSREAIQPAFDALLGVVDEVLRVEHSDVERARAIALGFERLSAREALHLAIMEQNSVMRILSFDEGFDGFPGVTRLFA